MVRQKSSKESRSETTGKEVACKARTGKFQSSTSKGTHVNETEAKIDEEKDRRGLDGEEERREARGRKRWMTAAWRASKAPWRATELARVSPTSERQPG